MLKNAIGGMKEKAAKAETIRSNFQKFKIETDATLTRIGLPAYKSQPNDTIDDTMRRYDSSATELNSTYSQL